MTDPYVALWIVLAAVMILIEVSTLNLVSIWVAMGSLVALIAAKIGYGLSVQIGVFFVASGAFLALTKPLVKRFLKPKREPTNADRTVGEEGVVIEDIDGVSGTGQIKVMGSVWSAKSADGSNFKKGERVNVKAIEGVKAVVQKKEE